MSGARATLPAAGRQERKSWSAERRASSDLTFQRANVPTCQRIFKAVPMSGAHATTDENGVPDDGRPTADDMGLLVAHRPRSAVCRLFS